MFFQLALAGLACIFVQSAALAQNLSKPDSIWIAVHTPTKYDRTRLANSGIAIETVVGETSYAFVSGDELTALRSQKFEIEKTLSSADFAEPLAARDFPTQDSVYHDYGRLVGDMQKLASDHKSFVSIFSIGKSVEGRDIWALRFNPDGLNVKDASAHPGILFLGGHHAREHLSVELPLLLAHYLAENNGRDPIVTQLLSSREIFIIPQTNPDGSEFDISGGSYHMWRKNRRPAGGARCGGVDLNRNYGYQWGTGGSSQDTCSDVYMGPSPFSEPETVAMKTFIEAHPNLKVLLSYHTYSELILYPWGHQYDPIANSRDHTAFDAMARSMAVWNGYTPEQSSALYIASGDTTDWAYGALGIFAFTFELSPSQFGSGGFYPGAGAITPAFQANLRPALYLIDLADNPYRASEAPQTTLFYGQH